MLIAACVFFSAVPSEPMNFANTSRTSSAIDFHWLPPLHRNGIIRSYQVKFFLLHGSIRRNWNDIIVLRLELVTCLQPDMKFYQY